MRPWSRNPNSLPIHWVLLLGVTAGAALPACAAAAGAPAASDAPADSTALARGAGEFGNLSPGTIVRLREDPAGGGFLSERFVVRKGVLARWDADSLWIATRAGAPERPVALADVQRIEVFAGEDRLSGALFGAVTGAAVGAVLALTLGSTLAGANGTSSDDAGLVTFIYMVGGGIVGLPVGATIGWTRGIDRWEPVLESP